MGRSANGHSGRSGSAGADEPAPRRASPIELIGVFGVLSTVFLTFVNSDPRTRIASACAFGAAAVVIWFLTGLFFERRTIRHRPIQLGTQIALISIFAIGIFVLPPNKQPDTATNPSPTTTTPPTNNSSSISDQQESTDVPASIARTLMTKQGYVLRPSSSILTNDQDKVDVDTGCPGWGSMDTSIGPSRCGEKADIIVEEDGIHTGNRGPPIYKLADNTQANVGTCIDALNSELDTGASRLATATLRVDDHICLRTDKMNITLVRVEAVETNTLGQLMTLTINFTTWKP